MEAVAEGFGRAGGEGGGCERTAGEGSGSTGEKAPKPAGHVWYDPLEETVIPCTVCNGRANGFHYGADTCAACKVRFSLPNKQLSYYQDTTVVIFFFCYFIWNFLAETLTFRVPIFYHILFHGRQSTFFP